MPHALSATSLSRAARVEPRLVAVAVAACPKSKVDFGLQQEQSRTIAESQANIDRGVSALKRAEDSRHVIQRGATLSDALDLVAWVGGKFVWEPWDLYFEIAAAMQLAAIELGVPVVWGAIWDRRLNDLPLGAAALRLEVEAYKARRRKLRPGKAVFLDGPHFQLARGL